MEPFSAAFLSSLSGKLSANVANSLTGALKRQIAGTPAQQALERSLRVALVALIARSTADEPEQAQLLAGIFEEFFHYPAVWVHVGGLLKDRPLDHDALRDLFADAGFDAATLPHLDFDAGLDAFEAAFIEVADGEKELQGIVLIGQSRRQTALQADMRDDIRRMAAAIGDNRLSAIRAGKIIYGDAVGQDKYELRGDFRGATIHIANQYMNAPGDPAQNEDKFRDALENYLISIENRYKKPELRGNIEVEDKEADILLENMYYSLAALDKPEAREIAGIMLDEKSGRRLESEPKQPDDMATLLRTQHRLVITGKPGSGKSTYLYLIASAVARALLGKGTDLVEKYVGLVSPLPLPIFISLGEFNEYKKSPPDPTDPRYGTLLAYAASKAIKEYEAFVPKDFFERLIVGNQTCLFLLDGLDEIADETERKLVSAEIRALGRNVKIGPIVVTCRSWAYVLETKLNAPFEEYEIQPMLPDQVDKLAEGWCLAAYHSSSAPELSAKLIREIRDLEARRRARGDLPLADTPLMVTIIAIVFYNDQHLPDQRAALYKRCVRVLLVEKNRPGGKGKFARLARGGTEEDKLELLSLLAYHMMTSFKPEDGLGDESERSDVGAVDRRAEEKDIRLWLLPLIADRQPDGRPGDHLRVFLRAMVDHAGMLDERPPTPGRDRTYEFVHLSFQEYLCAARLAGEPPRQVVDELLDKGYVSQSWWRETILLMPGHLGAVENRSTAFELLRELGGGVRRDAVALDAAELAATAYLELGIKGESTRVALAKGLETLLADPDLKTTNPARAAAGVALGRLGDPRPDVNCDIPATVLIPAGPFRMGSDKKDKQSPWYDDMAYEDEEPNHEVVIGFDYRVGRYPVTVAQYRRFVEAGGYDLSKSKSFWTPAGLKWLEESGQRAPVYWDDPQWTVDNHPVVGVTWHEAVAYCAWLNATKPSDRGFFRLPDEAMWEKAARGADGRRWPWGNDFDKTKLNSDSGGIGRTTAVGIFPAGRRQMNDADYIYDCAGNVWEWCSGPGYSEAQYPLEPRSYAEDLKLAAGTRALRGGSWVDLDQFTRAAYRVNVIPDYWLSNVGFRVVELLSDPDF